MMTNDRIVELLNYCGAEKINPYAKNGDEVRACCPVHGESNPSFSVSVSKQIFNCFSCGAKGHIVKLPMLVYPDRFKTMAYAETFIKETFGVTYGFAQITNDALYVPQYDDMFYPAAVRKTLPPYTLVAYKSGKETYKYFVDRGFTTKTIKNFMIGMDEELETVTIPVFWEDNSLAGIIGRYIDPPSYNQRYHVYKDFPRAQLLFPLNKFEDKNGEVILVEGILDAIWMHQLGYKNTLALMTNSVGKQQVSILHKLGNKFVLFFDSDSGGERAVESATKYLKGDITIMEAGDDPQSSTEKEIVEAYKYKEPIFMKGLYCI